MKFSTRYSVAKESWDAARANRMQAQLFADAEQRILNVFAAQEMEADLTSGRLILMLDGGGIEQVKINKQKAQEALTQSSDSFYDFINAAVEGAGIPTRQKPAAKEELDSNSTQDEFIEAISKAAADFIKSNRNAFNLDDAEAAKEFADVFTVDAVRERVTALLSQPDEEEQVERTADDTGSDDGGDDGATDTNSEGSSSDNDSDMVSADVMALLEE